MHDLLCDGGRSLGKSSPQLFVLVNVSAALHSEPRSARLSIAPKEKCGNSSAAGEIKDGTRRSAATPAHFRQRMHEPFTRVEDAGTTRAGAGEGGPAGGQD